VRLLITGAINLTRSKGKKPRTGPTTKPKAIKKNISGKPVFLKAIFPKKPMKIMAERKMKTEMAEIIQNNLSNLNINIFGLETENIPKGSKRVYRRRLLPDNRCNFLHLPTPIHLAPQEEGILEKRVGG